MTRTTEPSETPDVGLHARWPLERKLLALLLQTYRTMSLENLDWDEPTRTRSAIAQFEEAWLAARSSFEADGGRHGRGGV